MIETLTVPFFAEIYCAVCEVLCTNLEPMIPQPNMVSLIL